MHPVRRTVNVFFGLLFGVGILLLALSPDATVNVTNNSIEPMNVRIVWLDQEASLGWVPPGEKASFKIGGEAGVIVVASTAAGSSYQSEEVYFMSGWSASIIEASIENGEIHIEHKFAT